MASWSGVAGLLMATTHSAPEVPLRVDCLSVQMGAQRGATWAAAPERRLARAWAPLAAALDDSPQRVVWMPAHCTAASLGVKRLGDGSPLTRRDLDGNAYVDKLAKSVAYAARLPVSDKRRVATTWAKVEAVERWLGQVTVMANNCPPPHAEDATRRLRDSEAVGPHMRAPKRSLGQGAPPADASAAPSAKRALGDLSHAVPSLGRCQETHPGQTAGQGSCQ